MLLEGRGSKNVMGSGSAGDRMAAMKARVGRFFPSCSLASDC